jgi:hypothetical protein
LSCARQRTVECIRLVRRPAKNFPKENSMNRSVISGVIFATLVSSAVALAQDGKATAGAPAMPSRSAATSGIPGG